jgi:CheY-like chemotaxis protein
MTPGEEDSIHVRSDPALLSQILSNIVSNAIKYADPAKNPDCKVEISWRIVDDKVVIRVEDNGIGIEEQHLAGRKIFQPFFQANNNLPEGEKGVGLGLSIVNAALALMPDHRITVASLFGIGSQFAVYVPRAEATTTDAGSRTLTRQANLAGLAGKYVVLVDDDVLIRRSIVALLDHLGVLHDEYDSLADLSKHLLELERRPDVLLSDYRLPDKKTALDVMALMAQIWPRVPTVVVTGDAEAASTLSDRDDIAGVMHKPVSTAEMLNHLARACEICVSEDTEGEPAI